MNRRHNRVMVGIALFLGAASVQAASLRIGTPEVEPTRVTFPILLGGDIGTGISTCDFRFQYDAAAFQFVDVVPGGAVNEARKQVQGYSPAPGRCNVVMVGMDTDTGCQAGELAHIILERIDTDHAAANYRFSIAKPTLVRPDNAELKPSGSTRQVAFGSTDTAAAAAEEADEITVDTGSSADKQYPDAGETALGQRSTPGIQAQFLGMNDALAPERRVKIDGREPVRQADNAPASPHAQAPNSPHGAGEAKPSTSAGERPTKETINTHNEIFSHSAPAIPITTAAENPELAPKRDLQGPRSPHSEALHPPNDAQRADNFPAEARPLRPWIVLGALFTVLIAIFAIRKKNS